MWPSVARKLPPRWPSAAERRDERRGLGRGQPADVEALGLLHRDALAAGPLVVLGDREDQVAQLAEAGVGADRLGLAAVEVDRPAAERDGRRRPALGPDDPGGAASSRPSRRGPARGRRPGRRRRASAKYDAQPPIVPAPTTTRSAWSGVRHRPRIGRRPAASPGVAALIASAVARLVVSRRAPRPRRRSRRRPAAPGGRNVGRRRTVKAATSRPASATRAAEPRVDRVPLDGDPATLDALRERDRLRGKVVGVQPARPGRRQPPDALERRRLERRHDRPLEARPAAGRQDVERRRAPGRPSARRRGTRGAGWPPAPPRASGTPCAASSSAARSATRRATPWTRSSVSSWMTTGTPSVTARTSNSRPSQPGTSSAARNAASVFSGARRQSPRCASRRAGKAQPPSPIDELARRARGGRDGYSVGSPTAGRSNARRRDSTADRAADPDVVEAAGLAVGVHARRLEPRRPGDRGLGAVRLERTPTGSRRDRIRAYGGLGRLGVEVADDDLRVGRRSRLRASRSAGAPGRRAAPASAGTWWRWVTATRTRRAVDAARPARSADRFRPRSSRSASSAAASEARTSIALPYSGRPAQPGAIS